MHYNYMILLFSFVFVPVYVFVLWTDGPTDLRRHSHAVPTLRQALSAISSHISETILEFFLI